MIQNPLCLHNNCISINYNVNFWHLTDVDVDDDLIYIYYIFFPIRLHRIKISMYL